MRHRGVPFWAAFDFLAALVSAFVALLFLALVQQRRYTVPPALRTPGTYAVTAQWAGRLDYDVDLYCRDPADVVVYFANRQAGQLHLEADDLGYISDVTSAGAPTRHPRWRVERQVLRGLEPGEFACSVHLYRAGSPGPVRVVVELHRLIGADRVLARRTVMLAYVGQEQPAFQWTLGTDGRVVSITRLPVYIAAKAWGPS